MSRIMEMLMSKFMWAAQGTQDMIKITARITLICQVGDKSVVWGRKDLGSRENWIWVWVEIFWLTRENSDCKCQRSETEKGVFDKMGSKQRMILKKVHSFIHLCVYLLINGRNSEIRGRNIGSVLKNYSMLWWLNNIALYICTVPNLYMYSTQWHLQML